MNYPINIELYKEQTREDAEYPQEDKYNSNTILKTGLMWEHTKPKVGERFHVHQSKLWFNFVTSDVEEILEETKHAIKFKTLNSVYIILFRHD